VDPQLFRPAEVDHLRGDASRAREDLAWEPEVSFQEMIEMMVDADIARYTRSGRGAENGAPTPIR
jgi:GDPmannose 4,6-dehydratase